MYEDMNTVNRKFDPNEAPVLKTERDPMSHIVTPEQARDLQNTPAPGAQVPTAQVAPVVAQPLAVPAAVAPTPTTTGAIPQGQPPVQATDSRRVQDRINQLFGQKMEAQERNTAYESQISELRSQVAALQRPQPPMQAPYQNPQPQDYYGTPDPQAPPAGQYVSQDEFRRGIMEATQVLGSMIQNQQSQSSSRTVAEREFPEIFNDPELRQTVDNMLSEDAGLKADPQGPMKAALMVRGARDFQPEPAVAGVPASVRKPLLSAVGPSVPQGNVSVDDLANQYQAALQRATMTQDDNDFVEAMNLQKAYHALSR